MAEGWSSTAGNAALDDLVTTYPFIQLHTGAPGAAGTSNVAGNATRKQVTWGAASNGTVSNSAAVEWSTSDVDTSETYTHFTLWTAASGGTFGASGTITANAVTSGDEFTIGIGDLNITLTLAS